MAINKLIFKDAEKVRDSITESQKKEIIKLYDDWADKIGKMADKYAMKTTSSAPVSERYYKELKKQLTETSHQLSNELYKGIKNSMYLVSDSVVSDNVNWLKQFGFSEEGLNAAFSFVPDSVVRSIVTGQVYESGWSLSERIWGNNEDTLKDLYRIVAGGVAQQTSIYEISKQLEQYVRPEAAKQWNLKDKDGRMIYPKQVDYNAQRLARTLVQHSYQQSFDAVCHNNPFVIDYVWRANGSRVCELCMDRDGKHYPKDALPLDHPNGMCTMEPNVDDKMDDKLVEWFNSEDGTFPEIDEFAKEFGYDASQWQQEQLKFSDLQQKYLAPYGFTPENMPKNFDDWSHKLDFDQATEILNKMGTSWSDPHPYQQIQKYYEQNLLKFGTKSESTTEVKQEEKKVKVPEFTYLQNKYLGPLGLTSGDTLPTFDDWFVKAKYSDIEKLTKEASKLGMTDEEFYNAKIGKVKYKYKTLEEVKKIANAEESKNNSDVSNWIELIKKNTTSQMLAIEDEKRKLLNSDEENALERYTGSYYRTINGYLREIASGERVDRDSDMDKIIADMSSGLHKMKLDADLFVRRGTDVGDLVGLFMTGDFDENYQKLSGMSADELNKMFQGAIGEYAGFTSTSSIWDRGFSGDVEIVMHLPEGTDAQSIMRISRYGTAEGETLLNHGMRVKCELIEKSDGHEGSDIRVFLDIIPKDNK